MVRVGRVVVMEGGGAPLRTLPWGGTWSCKGFGGKTNTTSVRQNVSLAQF